MRAYKVLDTYESSSSSAVYEVRRGGDGVLYCTCRGWVASKDRPRACKHCKDYVARHPGIPWGPPGMFAVDAVVAGKPAKAPAATPGKKSVVVPAAPPPAAAPSLASFREALRRESAEAQARGVRTPAEALAAYESEVGRFLMVDDGGEVAAAVPVASSRALDVE